MEKKIKIGDHGQISFTLKTKNKCYAKDHKGDPFVIAGHEGRATIIDVDSKAILIRDRDGQEFIIPRAQIRFFEPCEKPEEMIIDERLQAMAVETIQTVNN